MEKFDVESNLECQICLSLICEPISIPCGHSFCRVCLVKSLKNAKICVLCRAICHISAEDANENVMIKKLATQCNPDLYASRLEEVKKEKDKWALLHPVFFYNSIMYPGEILKLHLFEPRYKKMMQRIAVGSRKFAYVFVRPYASTVIGNIALLANVETAEFMSDGRSLISAPLVCPRYKITGLTEDPGTDGLYYASLEPFCDVVVVVAAAGPLADNAAPAPPHEVAVGVSLLAEGNPQLETLLVEMIQKAKNLRAMSEEMLSPRNGFNADSFTPLPTTSGDFPGLEQFSLHLLGRLGVFLTNDARTHYLSSQDTLERLNYCEEIIRTCRGSRAQHTYAAPPAAPSSDDRTSSSFGDDSSMDEARSDSSS